MKYIWRVYYFFVPMSEVGKTGYVKRWARINGLRLIKMEISKNE